MTGETVRRLFGISDSASLFVGDENIPLLGDRMVAVSGNSRPTICYIGAAQGDNPQRIPIFRRFCERVGAEPKILSLFDPPSSDADAFFEDVDIIYIDGGSTRNLLALFREWDVIDALHKAYQRGVMLSGASAGLNIFFSWSITDSIKSNLRPVAGLGILKGSVCVHHDTHPDRPLVFEEFLKSGEGNFPAYALEDGVAVYFENEQLKEISSRFETAQVFSLAKSGDQIVRSPMRSTPSAYSEVK